MSRWWNKTNKKQILASMTRKQQIHNGEFIGYWYTSWQYRVRCKNCPSKSLSYAAGKCVDERNAYNQVLKNSNQLHVMRHATQMKRQPASCAHVFRPSFPIVGPTLMWASLEFDNHCVAPTRRGGGDHKTGALHNMGPGNGGCNKAGPNFIF